VRGVDIESGKVFQIIVIVNQTLKTLDVLVLNNTKLLLMRSFSLLSGIVNIYMERQEKIYTCSLYM
jgi:hypothetical protein